MHVFIRRSCLSIVLLGSLTASAPAAEPAGPWRELPLIADGKIHPDWVHLGGGEFVVEDGALWTKSDATGMGLLLYRKERLGDCQIRVVYKGKDARANSGVYVRIGDGILERIEKNTDAYERDKNGNLTDRGLARMKADSEAERSVWYPVHHGYEVQICDAADEWHRTGAIYSLAKAAAAPKATGWKTMIITLEGSKVAVEVDGKQVSSFDSRATNLPPRKEWYEPKREPKRPEQGFIGLQNHDPGDVVYFKEVSVRRLPTK